MEYVQKVDAFLGQLRRETGGATQLLGDLTFIVSDYVAIRLFQLETYLLQAAWQNRGALVTLTDAIIKEETQDALLRSYVEYCFTNNATAQERRQRVYGALRPSQLTWQQKWCHRISCYAWGNNYNGCICGETMAPRMSDELLNGF